MILQEVYLLICTLFLAGKDATSYQLKDKNRPVNSLDTKRIQRWHRDGVILNLLFLVPLLYYSGNYWLFLSAILIRLSVFDIVFNKWVGLDIHSLGSTALADRVLAKIFGNKGAFKKSIFFLICLIALNFII